MSAKSRKQFLFTAGLVLSSQFVFANELNKMGDIFVFSMAVLAAIVFFLLLPVFFFIRSKFAIGFFTILNVAFFIINRFHFIPEDMFLNVLLWFHGALQLTAIISYKFSTKKVDDEKEI